MKQTFSFSSCSGLRAIIDKIGWKNKTKKAGHRKQTRFSVLISEANRH